MKTSQRVLVSVWLFVIFIFILFPPTIYNVDVGEDGGNKILLIYPGRTCLFNPEIGLDWKLVETLKKDRIRDVGYRDFDTRRLLLELMEVTALYASLFLIIELKGRKG